jgi:hypothetical protein
MLRNDSLGHATNPSGIAREAARDCVIAPSISDSRFISFSCCDRI